MNEQVHCRDKVPSFHFSTTLVTFFPLRHECVLNLIDNYTCLLPNLLENIRWE